MRRLCVGRRGFEEVPIVRCCFSGERAVVVVVVIVPALIAINILLVVQFHGREKLERFQVAGHFGELAVRRLVE